MNISDSILRRMRDAGEKGRAEGVAIAQELLDAVHDSVQGAYFIPPFGKYERVLDVLDGLPWAHPPAVAALDAAGQGD